MRPTEGLSNTNMADTSLNFILNARDNASASIRTVSNALGDLGSTGSFASDAVGGLASAVAAVGAGAAIKAAVSSFADAEQTMNNFEAIMSTLPPSLQALRPQIMQAAENAIYLGFSNEDAALGMAKFLKILGNGPDAFKALTAAEGVAVMHHESLADGIREVILGMEGMGRTFKEDGIVVDSHLTKQQNLANIFGVAKAALDKYNGSTAQAIAATKAIGDQVQQSIGQQFAEAFKPVIEAVLTFIKTHGGIMKLLDDWKPAFEIIAAVLTGVVAAGFAIAIAAAVALAATVGTTAGIIALAIGAIVAGVTFLVLNFNDFKKSALQTWEDIKGGLQVVGDFIVEKVWKPMVDWLDNIYKKLQAVWDSITRVTSKVGGAVSGAFNSVVSGAKNLVGLADGGIVTGPTLAMVGEGGGPEAVIPLSQLSRYTNGTGGGITINMNGNLYTSTEAAESFGNELAFIIKNQLNLSGIHA